MMTTVPTVPARHRTPTWLWVLLTLVALAVLIACAAVGWVASLDGAPVHVVIDGTEYGNFDLASLPTGHKAGLVAGLVLAIVAVMVVVPVALLIGLAGLAIGLVFGLGLPLLIVALVLALVCSPIVLLVALVWWVLRKSRAPAAPHAANIAG
jgi:hypothetical protein